MITDNVAGERGLEYDKDKCSYLFNMSSDMTKWKLGRFYNKQNLKRPLHEYLNKKNFPLT